MTEEEGKVAAAAPIYFLLLIKIKLSFISTPISL